MSPYTFFHLRFHYIRFLRILQEGRAVFKKIFPKISGNLLQKSALSVIMVSYKAICAVPEVPLLYSEMEHRIRLYPPQSSPMSSPTSLQAENRCGTVCAVLPCARETEGRAVADILAVLSPETVLCTVAVDWNRELSPWQAPRAFSGGEDFGGGGSEFLAFLIGTLLPYLSKTYGFAQYALCGYSLAGLFALWAMMETDAFAGIASMSGSLWYDGFLTCLEKYGSAHRIPGFPVYLSLGDRESAARNPRLASVGVCTERAADILCASGCCVKRASNPGNHFADVAQRCADGIAWICGEIKNKQHL